jgi:hypothetical protein
VKASVRRDQASSFGADSKPFYSPSAGVSYVISDEDYFQRAMSFLPEGFLTTLRLRAAYGQTGRHPTSGARSTFNPSTNQISSSAVEVGVRPGATGNAEIRAEKGSEIELGFESGLLDDRLGLEFTYFKRTTKDGILSLPVPGSQGSSSPLVNVGELQNSGLEIAANARPLTRRNVALEVRVAANTLNNKLVDLGGVPESSTRKVGLPLTGMWDYAIREVDLANNRVIVSDTLEFLGNTSLYPGYEGTLSGTLTLFGNLSFYALADGRGDVMQYDNTAQFRDRQNGFTGRRCSVRRRTARMRAATRRTRRRSRGCAASDASPRTMARRSRARAARGRRRRGSTPMASRAAAGRSRARRWRATTARTRASSASARHR